VYTCGYRPRCALEISDSSENRLSKIESIIADSQLGIHDISFTNIDQKTKLPRFNMPFEPLAEFIDDGEFPAPSLSVVAPGLRRAPA